MGGWIRAISHGVMGFGYLDWGSGQAVKELKVTEQDIIKDKQLNYVRQWVELGG